MMDHPTAHRLVFPFDAAGLERLDALSHAAAATLAHAPLTGTHVLDVSMVAGALDADEADPSRLFYWAVPPRSAHEGLVRAGWQTHALEAIAATARALAAAFVVPMARVDLSLSASRTEDGFCWSWTAHVWTPQARIAFSPKGQADAPSVALARFQGLCQEILSLPPEDLRSRLA